MTADHLDSDKTILHGRAIYPSTGEGRKGVLMMDGEVGSSFETGEMMDLYTSPSPRLPPAEPTSAGANE